VSDATLSGYARKQGDVDGLNQHRVAALRPIAATATRCKRVKPGKLGFRHPRRPKIAPVIALGNGDWQLMR
jgi:hypothetical protein